MAAPDPINTATTPDPAPAPAPAAASIVYALGSNGSGQLGVGHTVDVRRAQRCVFSSIPASPSPSILVKNEPASHDHDERLQEVHVEEIVAGGNHTLLLTRDGRVFTAGKFIDGDDDDRDGTTAASSVVFHERSHAWPFCAGRRITHVAATWDASFVVDERNDVWACGTGGKGELGMGPDVQRVVDGGMKKVFELPLEDRNGGVEIVSIVACMVHVVVLLSNGKVFGWGSCRKGQLGEDFKKDKILWVPTRIDCSDDGVGRLPFAPERVVLGRDYTVFLRTGEEPLIWGETRSFGKDVKKPVADGDIVTSGWSSIHTASSRPSPEPVQSVGKNDHGQHAPDNLPSIRMVAGGSEHCIALTEDNRVIAWGWGEHGNCGEELDQKGNVAGRFNEISLPRLDEGLVVTKVAAGCATSFIVCGKPG